MVINNLLEPNYDYSLFKNQIIYINDLIYLGDSEFRKKVYNEIINILIKKGYHEKAEIIKQNLNTKNVNQIILTIIDDDKIFNLLLPYKGFIEEFENFDWIRQFDM